MMTEHQQRELLDAIRAATHGMAKDEKRKAQELILMGAVLALSESAPQEWKSLLMIGRAHKLFTR